MPLNFIETKKSAKCYQQWMLYIIINAIICISDFYQSRYTLHQRLNMLGHQSQTIPVVQFFTATLNKGLYPFE